ncbi:MAG: hypothetical protein HYZ71_06885 [Deltaproteobacteria bacterium]|nr:hypothetical protein [Deltaproteobacteria bacterium]
MTVDTSTELVPQTAFELFSGRHRAGLLRGKRLVGNAYLSAGSDCYQLKLMMLPGNTYYMKRNREGVGCFTVYAGHVPTQDRTKYLSPVGYGRMLEKTKDFVEIYFPLFGRLVFLDIFPKNRGGA